MQDFPAAHSMDTTWFAVDSEGHIGVFDSCEEGAVPVSNSKFQRELWNQDYEDLELYDTHKLFWAWSQETENRTIDIEIPSTEILDKLGIDLVKLDASPKNMKKLSPKILPASISTPWIDEEKISNPNSDSSWGYHSTHWLLILSRDEAEIFEILKKNCLRSLDYADYIVRFSGEPILVFLTDCTQKTLTLLFEKDWVRYAIPLRTYRSGAATLLGLFSYDCDYSGPLPYECDGQPIYPLKLDDLPEKLQDILTWNWFDRVKFSESRKIQPIEHMQCDTWGNSKFWVDTEGNNREGHPHDRPT